MFEVIRSPLGQTLNSGCRIVVVVTLLPLWGVDISHFSNFFCFQLLKCESVLLFVVTFLVNKVLFWVLDCWWNKTRTVMASKMLPHTTSVQLVYCILMLKTTTIVYGRQQDMQQVRETFYQPVVESIFTTFTHYISATLCFYFTTIQKQM